MIKRRSFSIFTFFLLLQFGSCAPVVEIENPTRVKFSMPKSNHSLREITRTAKAPGGFPNPTLFAQSDATSVDDFDCYFVALSFQFDLKGGACTGEVLLDNIRMVSPTVVDGGVIEMENVPTNIPISFMVFGYKNDNGGDFCPDYRTLQTADMSRLSRAVLVGVTRQELAPQPDNIVDINISFDDPKIINGCSSGPFRWPAGGVFGAAKFGNTTFGP